MKLSFKQPLRLAFILFSVLILFIIIVEQPGSFEKKEEKRARFFMPKLISEEVARVEIRYADQDRLPVALLRQDLFWVDEADQRFPVDPVKISTLVEALYSLKEEALVSRNPDKHELYGVNEGASDRVQVWNFSGKIVGDFFVGYEAGLASQYVRRANEKNVYQVNHVLLPLIQHTVESWRSKRPLSFNPEEVIRIQVMTPEGEWVAENTPEGWKLLTPREAILSADSVTNYLHQWLAMDAIDLLPATEAAEARLKNPDYKITLRLKDDTLKLAFFSYDAKTETYTGKNAEQSSHYRMDSDFLKELFGFNPTN